MGYLWDKTDDQIKRDAAAAKRRRKEGPKKPAMERVHDASKPGKTTVRPSTANRGGRVHDASKRKGRFRTGQSND